MSQAEIQRFFNYANAWLPVLNEICIIHVILFVDILRGKFLNIHSVIAEQRKQRETRASTSNFMDWFDYKEVEVVRTKRSKLLFSIVSNEYELILQVYL